MCDGMRNALTYNSDGFWVVVLWPRPPNSPPDWDVWVCDCDWDWVFEPRGPPNKLEPC